MHLPLFFLLSLAHQCRTAGGNYASVAAFGEDVNLVWNNAFVYNLDESYIYQVAAQLKAISDKKLTPILAKELADKKSNAPPEITYEMKRHLNESCGHLSSKDLYGMMSILEELCKKSVNEPERDMIEIDLEKLDAPTFLKVDKYVRDCLNRANKKAKQQHDRQQSSSQMEM